MSVNPDALDYWRRARLAEENGDLEEAELLDQQYRQLLREPLPPEPAPAQETEAA